MKHLVMRTSQFAVTILHYAISPLNQMEVEAFPRCLVSFTGFALIIVLTDPRVIVGQPWAEFIVTIALVWNELISFTKFVNCPILF